MAKTQAVATAPSAELMQQLRDSFPIEPSANRILLPRISFASQDKTEGKGKTLKVVTEAGTFFIEKEGDEVSDEGKKVWEKEEIGSTFDGVILYRRKQLKMYDSATNEFSSTPIYDTEDEVLPLFKNRQEVDRGTPAELQSHYQFVDANGKTKSKLEINQILYVLYKGEVYQMNLRSSSMYSYLGYVRDLNKRGQVPPAVVTRFGSTAEVKGATEWNQMSFEAVSLLDDSQAQDNLAKINEIRSMIKAEKGQYIQATREQQQVDASFKRDF